MLVPILSQPEDLPHALLRVIAGRLGAIICHIQLLQQASHVQQNMRIFETLTVALCRGLQSIPAGLQS